VAIAEVTNLVEKIMKHSYQPGCECPRCSRECARRIAQSLQSVPKPRPVYRNKPRNASRSEQYARYLDCGPQAWDDR
jgi:hypothetical protein